MTNAGSAKGDEACHRAVESHFAGYCAFKDYTEAAAGRATPESTGTSCHCPRRPTRCRQLQDARPTANPNAGARVGFVRWREKITLVVRIMRRVERRPVTAWREWPPVLGVLFLVVAI